MRNTHWVLKLFSAFFDLRFDENPSENRFIIDEYK